MHTLNPSAALGKSSGAVLRMDDSNLVGNQRHRGFDSRTNACGGSPARKRSRKVASGNGAGHFPAMDRWSPAAGTSVLAE
ncbi:MAG: hypothetical protein JWR19_2488 [Pedosphaera sp.]|nr:hypothetical protein [Pedosphaera sp.]